MKKTSRLLSLLLVFVLCLSVLPLSAAAATSGWQEEGDFWVYYENGSRVTGWKQIGGYWYYFVPEWNGGMFTGFMNTDPAFFSGGEGPFTGDWYHFSDSGKMDASKWVKNTYTFDGITYTDWGYALSSGKLAKGWKQISGVWYYFDPELDGVMLTGGPYEIGGKWYYFKDSGALYTGWKSFTDTYEEAGETHTDTYWYYFTSNGAAMGWKQIGGVWYYFDPESDGVMLTGGPYEIGGKWYYFKDSGALYTGWKKFVFTDLEPGKETVFWTYFTSNGAAFDEWKKIDGKWYYFDYATMVTGGPYKLSGSYYYFSDSGAMYTGWKYTQKYDIGPGWWYFTSSGAAVKDGWQRINSKWYQFKDYILVE